ncbi:hypothetical protein [Pseudonocardia asaccharolytica]|nr:hypothetical protein [Pseudonocardia asaccharolytica]
MLNNCRGRVERVSYNLSAWVRWRGVSRSRPGW